jgi:hypothetical protein
MPIVKILEIAAKITTVFGFSAFAWALYLWAVTRNKDKSLRQIVAGDDIVNQEAVIKVLKQFGSDDKRLAALESLLSHDRDRAASILEKVKSNVDLGALSAGRENQWTRRIVYLGIVLLVLAVVLAAISRSGVSSGPEPGRQTSPTPTSELNRSGPREPLPDDVSAVSVENENSIRFTLSDSFIERYALRATIAPKMLIDEVGRIHRPEDDGDLHFAGRTEQVLLPVVGEIMNAKTVPDAVANVNAAKGGKDAIQIAGAWRLWPERSGHEQQEQGADVPQLTSTNPEHIFEVHPVTRVGPISVLETLKPIQGFEGKNAQNAFARYEQMPCSLSHDPVLRRTRIKTRLTGYNYVDFVLELTAKPVDLEDGKSVVATIRDKEGGEIATGKQMIFVHGSEPEQRLSSAKIGDRISVIGMPRLSLARVEANVKSGSSSCAQSYEMVIVGVY